MKNRIRVISIVLVILLTLSLLAACKKEEKNVNRKFDGDASESIKSGVVASNGDFELSWNNDGKFIILKNIKTGKIWSNIPYEYYLSGGTSSNVNSTLNITISDSQTLKWDNIDGYSDAFLDGRITSKKIKNGIEITYYFDRFKISVPVVYKLRKDSLEMSIDSEKIVEGKNSLLVSVTPSPFMCSSANSKDSYLFVPTGSGALMYTDERTDGDRLYSGEFYGDDGSRMLTSAAAEEEPIKMPVYGVCDGSEALLSIIENGDEAATLNAAAGNKRTGYSNVYSTFYFRSFDKVNSGIQSLDYEDITKVSENMIKDTVKIGYYPLSGDDASYVGMAKRYKKYIKDNKLLTETEENSGNYGVTVYGGTLIDSTRFGMPSLSLDVMTDFKQALDMLKTLSSVSKQNPEILLKGFSDSGINPGKIGGGFAFPSDFGSNKDRKELEKYCSDKGYKLYTDYDIVRYRSSGSGFSYTFDSAKSPSLQAVEKSPVQIPLRQYDKSVEYRLVKRAKLQTAVDKLIKSSDKLSVSGVGLSTLSSIAYSDYSDVSYYSKGNMANDVAKFIKQIQKSKHNVAVDNANLYAALNGNTVFNAPVDNGGYYVFDKAIPFYEMVLVGKKSVYSSAVNTAADINKQIMLSVSSGAKLSFALADDFKINDLDIQSEKFYSAKLEYNRELIKNTLERYAPVYAKISGSEITDYQLLENGISKTVFDNGVCIYANHTAVKAVTPAGELEAYGILTE